MRSPLLIMRSFRGRILALAIGLVIMVLAATVASVVAKARVEVARDASAQLRSAAETAHEVLRFRGNQLASAVQVLTSDFGFKEAVASGDVPTLLSAMDNHRARIGADVLTVLDADGRPIDSTLANVSAVTLADLQELVASDADTRLLRVYRLIDGRPYQLVIAPVLAPEPIAWTAMGFALNNKVARDMAGLLGVDVSFVASGDAQPAFVGSSLSDSEKGRLRDVASLMPATPFAVRTTIGQILTWTDPIRSANGPLTLVLQRSLSGALRPYEQLRNSIIAIGLVIFGLASALAALLARSGVRPVDELIRAAERLEAGDYDAELPRASTTELAQLSSAFNAMRSAVAGRERTILHQASHDALTGLPTRSRITVLLDGVLIEARRHGQAVTVCLEPISKSRKAVCASKIGACYA